MYFWLLLLLAAVVFAALPFRLATVVLLLVLRSGLAVLAMAGMADTELVLALEPPPPPPGLFWLWWWWW